MWLMSNGCFPVYAQSTVAFTSGPNRAAQSTSLRGQPNAPLQTPAKLIGRNAGKDPPKSGHGHMESEFSNEGLGSCLALVIARVKGQRGGLGGGHLRVLALEHVGFLPAPHAQAEG